MSEKRKKYDREFRDGAVRIARRRVSRSRRWLVSWESTRARWALGDAGPRGPPGHPGPVQGDIEELKRGRAENAKLRMERDVLIG